ncbi:hypothetical protein SLS60_004427 [Paraconiothyrium brasiliense]|uniref:Uncharacterized protein n=1 Tax=Paraconiothyrium brasiliense TaxID=300254 RepID=A0ABR3RLW9_9PLEO
MVDANTYFRFNVDLGLSDISFDDYKAIGSLQAVTYAYLGTTLQRMQLEACAKKLSYPKPQPINALRPDPGSGEEHESPHNPDHASPTTGSGQDFHAESDVDNEEHDDSIRPSDDKATTVQLVSLPENPREWKIGSVLIHDISELVLQDSEILSLLASASGKIGRERMKKNLYILLEALADDLLREEQLHDIAVFMSLTVSTLVDQIIATVPDRKTGASKAPPTYEEVVSASIEMEDLAPNLHIESNTETLDEARLIAFVEQENCQLIVQSESFRRFREDLRKFTYPSVGSWIRAKALPHSPDLVARGLAPIHTFRVSIVWQLEKFLDLACSGPQSIDNILTLTGHYHSCQALPCGEYMNQTWPKTGSKTLEAVRLAFEYGSVCQQYSEAHSIRLTTRKFDQELRDTASPKDESMETSADLLIHGKLEEICETLEQFAWLSAALRFGGERLSYSRVLVGSDPLIQDSDITHLHIHLAPLYDEIIEGVGTCWVPLFNRSVLAWGFPIAERGDAFGLELTFDLMLRACGTKYPTEYKDALIISRDWITIYPCRAIEDIDNGFEWHAVSGTPDDFFRETTIAPVYPLLNQVNPVSKALEGRMFVGWVAKSKVRLATFASAEQGSTIDPENHRGATLGNGVTIGAHLRPPWMNLGGINMAVPVEIPLPQQEIFAANNIDEDAAMERSKNDTVLLYDYRDEIGWLVPELSFALHLVFSGLRSHSSNNKALQRLRYAHALSDGGEAARDAIRQCASIAVGMRGNEEYTLSEMMKDTLDFLDSRKRSIALRIRNNSLRADLGLRGYDFLDLRDKPATFGLRYIDAPKVGRPDWWDITNELNSNLLVVLANNLGQIIVPDSSSWRSCTSWQEVPRKCGLLVATVRSVLAKARPFIARQPKILLTQKLAWHEPVASHPFDVCQHNCNPVQKVRRHYDGVLGYLSYGFHGLNNPTNPHARLDGAVIFGLPDGRPIGKHIEDQLDRIQRPCGPIDLQPATQGQPKFLTNQGFMSLVITSLPSFIVVRTPSWQAMVGCLLAVLLSWALWL